MATPIVTENGPGSQGPARTPARPRTAAYDRRDEIARAQGFESYWHKRKALAAGQAGPDVDGRNPRWRAKQQRRRAA